MKICPFCTWTWLFYQWEVSWLLMQRCGQLQMHSIFPHEPMGARVMKWSTNSSSCTPMIITCYSCLLTVLTVSFADFDCLSCIFYPDMKVTKCLSCHLLTTEEFTSVPCWLELWRVSNLSSTYLRRIVSSEQTWSLCCNTLGLEGEIHAYLDQLFVEWQGGDVDHCRIIFLLAFPFLESLKRRIQKEDRV